MINFAASPAGAAIVGIIGATLFFLPSILVHIRSARSASSIMEVNALMMVTFVCILMARWFLWATLLLWLGATAWAIASGTKRKPNQVPDTARKLADPQH